MTLCFLNNKIPPTITATTPPVKYELNIPYPPRAINKKGVKSLTTASIAFLISTYFDERNATKTDSITKLSDAKIVNMIKSTEYIMLWVTNPRGGEKKPRFKITITPKINELIVTNEMMELIRAFLSFEVGKNLIIPVSEPKRERADNKLTTAISEVAIPIW